MINFTNSLYVNQKYGDDKNNGTIQKPLKSFIKAKELISENGVVYIIGEYKTEEIEFISDKKIHVFGCDEKSKIIYFTKFGDHVNILDNVDFYKLNMVVGDSRYDFEPQMSNNFYNCIINMNGSQSDNSSNFYNCLFISSNTECGYRSGDSGYQVHGKFENCIFNKKYFNGESSFRNIFNNKGNNIFLDDINDIVDTKKYDVGIYKGLYPYYFNKYFVMFGNHIYKIINNELVNTNINDTKNDTCITDVDENIINNISDNFNIIKYNINK